MADFLWSETEEYEALPQPTRYVPVVLVETIERVVWVDEETAEDVPADRWESASGDAAYSVWEAFHTEEPTDSSVALRRPHRFEVPDLLVGPQEACPHCGALADVDSSPVWTSHEVRCPLWRHYAGSRCDLDAPERPWYMTCRCGWTGPQRPEERDAHGRLTNEFRVRLELDGREHVQGRPHNDCHARHLGMPDLPSELSCWRPVAGATITHLIPAEAVRRG